MSKSDCDSFMQYLILNWIPWLKDVTVTLGKTWMSMKVTQQSPAGGTLMIRPLASSAHINFTTDE